MTLTQELESQLQDMANRLRIDSIQSTNAAKSGYISFIFHIKFKTTVTSMPFPLSYFTNKFLKNNFLI
jgi:hypothetical protein